ncbi:MAG: hypothetical protein V4722_22730 [Bacteroidota bacterium]
MKRIILLIAGFIAIANANAQNVGIGTITPAEKLDVNGHIKTTGELKPNGAAGQAGQVLTSNGNGTMQWSSAASAGSSNYSNIGGYGSWGGCEMNNISDFFPVADSAGISNDGFASAVAISGDYAIVGNSSSESGVLEAGSAVIYKRNPGTGIWEKQVRLSKPFPAQYDHFGISVAINDNYAVVGVPYDDVAGLTNNGAIYIYKRDAATGIWSFMVKIFGQSSQTGDLFGRSVAISGDYIVVGAPSDNEAGHSGTGSVSVYKRNAGIDAWDYLQKLTDPVPVNNESFGYSVSISGDQLIVGAVYDSEPNNNGNFTSNGSATLFKRNVSTGIWQSTVSFSGNSDNEQFGYSVSISGNNALVSAINGDNISCPDCGAVMFLSRNAAGTWVQGFRTGNGGTSDTNFGASVSVSGDYAIIGDNLSNSNEGKAWLYKKLNNMWVLLQKFSSPYPSTGPYPGFGSAVGIDGITKRFLVGAPGMNFLGMAFFGKVN